MQLDRPCGHTERAGGFVQSTVIRDLADLARVIGALDQGRGSPRKLSWPSAIGELRIRFVESRLISIRPKASQAVAQWIGMTSTGECEDEEIWAAELVISSPGCRTDHRRRAR